MVTKNKTPVRIAGITTGKIVDYGVKDSMNMGACMAPAAADLIETNLKDFGVDANYYDRIITGDLGTVGRTILIDLLAEKGVLHPFITAIFPPFAFMCATIIFYKSKDL